MNPESDKYLVKAEHALQVAEDLMAAGHLPDAASKINDQNAMKRSKASADGKTAQ